eukprot:scaffold17685_cov63-Phaeocystis_antarctica.AAC.4
MQARWKTQSQCCISSGTNGTPFSMRRGFSKLQPYSRPPFSMASAALGASCTRLFTLPTTTFTKPCMSHGRTAAGCPLGAFSSPSHTTAMRSAAPKCPGTAERIAVIKTPLRTHTSVPWWSSLERAAPSRGKRQSKHSCSGSTGLGPAWV